MIDLDQQIGIHFCGGILFSGNPNSSIYFYLERKRQELLENNIAFAISVLHCWLFGHHVKIFKSWTFLLGRTEMAFLTFKNGGQ